MAWIHALHMHSSNGMLSPTLMRRETRGKEPLNSEHRMYTKTCVKDCEGQGHIIGAMGK